MLGYAVMRFGMSPSEFWESSPWETDAIARAYLSARNDDGIRESYFVGHQIAALGQFKQRVKAKTVIDGLSAPFREDAGTWIAIRSKQDFDRWTEDHEIYLSETVKNG
jgi:hypothetical protein